ncbi:MAG: AraC family transcriptional regulator [Rhizomicrobium sp.]
MTGQEFYGETFARRFGAPTAPAFVTRTLKKSAVAVTYLRQEQPTFELSDRPPVEDAFLVSLGWGHYPKFQLFENDRAVPSEPIVGGTITIYDLKEAPRIHVNSPLIGLHFHLPRGAFDSLADEAGVRRITGLNAARGRGIDDPVMRGLSMALMPAFETPEQASRLFVEHVTLAAAAHIAQTYGGMAIRAMKRGGLAPWQERRTMELIDAHLDGDLAPAAMAAECGLSASHFARAFRASTGMAPHQWLLRRRVEKAKAAMRETVLPLAEIAVRCGFADQSHFTRVFTRIAGTSPAAWRRAIRD